MRVQEHRVRIGNLFWQWLEDFEVRSRLHRLIEMLSQAWCAVPLIPAIENWMFGLIS
jgi:hypothetical protein